MNIRSDWRWVGSSKWLLAIMVAVLAASAPRATAQSSCAGVSNDAQGAVTWTPQWCQEFNGTVGSPDTTVWSFDLGNGGFGNKEIETYCGPPGYSGNPTSCPSTFSTATSNAYVDGSGHLVIQALTIGGIWYSARMKTEGLENFQYGRIEASIQIPDTTNQGLWPAFWSLGSNINSVQWPACGETDFMEVWSPQVAVPGPGPSANKTTIHTAATDGSGLQPNGTYTFPSGQANDTNFHTYGVIWSANMQQFYIDNPLQPYYIVTTSDLASGDTWPFNAQIFLLANIAVGGTLGGTPSTSTPNPGIMMMDYVRQYQPSAPVPAPTLGTANPASISVTAGATTGNTSTLTPSLTAGGGYVYFSCSTNAPKASCAITTTDPLDKYVVNSSATPAETVTVLVATTTNAASNRIPAPLLNRKFRGWLSATALGFLVSVVVPPISLRRRRAWLYSSIVLAAVFLMGAASCGGGGTNNQVTPPGNTGTLPGSYTVTVYAFTESNVSNGVNSNADASVDIPLTVN